MIQINVALPGLRPALSAAPPAPTIARSEPQDEFHPLAAAPHMDVLTMRPADVASPAGKLSVAARMLEHMEAYPSVKAVVGMAPAADGNTSLIVASREDALSGSQLQGAYQIIQHLASSPSVKVAAQAHPVPFQAARPIDAQGRVLELRLPGQFSETSFNQAYAEGGQPNRKDLVQSLLGNLPQGKRVAVLIGGPSGAGKSTLIDELKKMAGNRKVVVLSGDMYFRDADSPELPKTSAGSVYWDDIKAMDMDRFKSDISQLIGSGSADVPVYNFKDVRPGGWRMPGVNTTGFREDKPQHLEIGKDDLLVIDSLHSTNSAITEKLEGLSLPHASIYLDSERSDDRLLRRLVRDYDSRSRAPEQTLSDWDNSTFPGEVRFVRPTIAQVDAAQDVFLITKFPNDQGLSREEIDHKVGEQKKWGLPPTYAAFATPDAQLKKFAASEVKRLEGVIKSSAPEADKSKARTTQQSILQALVLDHIENTP